MSVNRADHATNKLQNPKSQFSTTEKPYSYVCPKSIFQVPGLQGRLALLQRALRCLSAASRLEIEASRAAFFQRVCRGSAPARRAPVRGSCAEADLQTGPGSSADRFRSRKVAAGICGEPQPFCHGAATRDRQPVA